MPSKTTTKTKSSLSKSKKTTSKARSNSKSPTKTTADAAVAPELVAPQVPADIGAVSANPNPAGIYGFDRAEELELNFSKAFSQQFVMRRDPDFALTNFRQARLGEWSLLTGSRMPVVQAHLEEANLHVAFLGKGVDAEGALIDDQVLQSKLERLRDPQAIADDLNDCGGRFVFIITAPCFERLYIDPSGIMGAVYNQETGLVAASVHLTIDRPLEPTTEYPAARIASDGSGGRFAFGFTPDRDVKRVLANHYLDLNDFSQTRHWPTEDDDFTCPMREDVIRARLYDVIARHKVIMNAMIRSNSPAILPITGGADSRLLLAFAKDALDDVDLFFTHKTNFNTGRDMELAEELAKRAGVTLTRFDLVENPDLVRTRRMCTRLYRHEKLAEGLFDEGPDPDRKKISERLVLPTGGVLLRGHVTDLSKAVLWQKIGVREFERQQGMHHASDVGLRLLKTGDDAFNFPWYHEQYNAWMATLPENARRRAVDFMSLEQFRCHGLGAQFYTFTHNFYMAPGNDRRIIKALVSIPPHLRSEYHINDMLLEQCAPELMDVPYTRYQDNDLRETRRKFGKLLAQGPEVV
jgi:hypothetical protein